MKNKILTKKANSFEIGSKGIIMRKLIVSLFCCLSITLFAEFNPRILPKQIRSCYGNYKFKNGNVELEMLTEKNLKAMQKAKFNVCDLKLHFWGLPKEKWFEAVASLVDRVNQHQMVFTAYTYPILPGKKAGKKFPKVVDEQGKIIHSRYNLFDYKIWEEALQQVFVLAKFSNEIPIVAVKIDLEEIVVRKFAIPYNKELYEEFCKLVKLQPCRESQSRFRHLKDSGKLREYYRFLENKLANIVKQLRRKLHRINPKLHLGMMPGENKLLFRAFMRELGTKKVPAIIDNWSMYNGSGFIDNVCSAVNFAKQMNPNNLAVSWLQISNYYPQSIPSHVYHAAHYGNGYSNWELAMLIPNNGKSKIYQLPAGTSPEQYWQAYKHANKALDEDNGVMPLQPRLKLEKITPFVAELKLDDIKIPLLVPHGKGYRKSRNLMLRDRQIIYFYGKTGETIHVEIYHAAGEKRPQSLQYAIMDKDRNVLQNGSISAHEKRRIEITMSYTGIGALVVTGGRDGYGYAWYQVNIDSSYIGIDTSHTRGYFFRPPCSLYFLDTTGSLTTFTGKNEIFELILNKKFLRSVKGTTPLEIKASDKVSEIIIRPPSKISSGLYTQDIYFKSSLKNPVYLSDHPERLLIPKKR